MTDRIDTTRAFEAVFRTHYESLARFAFRILRDRAAAEDVVQEVFGNLWDERRTVRPMNIRAYLFTAVRNRALNDARRTGRLSSLDDDEADLPSPIASNDPTPDQQYDLVELRSRLSEALADLPERQASAMLLRWRDELSYEEIASILGISVAGVEKHLTRGLAALRQRFSR
ncbi:MAG TPA: sigma-70 family RNA polymerase sigma factor [Gemmatimonadaceae bacterium]|jgi:RNA polymerase sigma-70 factor (ECF subfamily)